MPITQRVALVLLMAGLLLAPVASASHLAMPESTLYHGGKIYVSLIGDPENNDGAIVTVDSTGRVTGTLVRASGARPLVDPTGMAITGSTLWVNDMKLIRSYNLRTGAAGRVVKIPGSIFVNDLAVDRRGNLWASDSETRSLYRVNAAGGVTRLRLPKVFKGLPNGVALHPDSGEIWFVTFNESAVGGAQVGRVSPAGVFTEVISSPRLRQLDGLAFVGSDGIHLSLREREHLEAVARRGVDTPGGHCRKSSRHLLRACIQAVTRPAYPERPLRNAQAVGSQGRLIP